MASTIILKNGTSGAPAVANMEQGEMAIDVAKGKLFYGTVGGTAVSSSFTFTDITASGNISIGGAITSLGTRINANQIGANGNVGNTEYGYLNGVTGAIQTQLNTKLGLVDGGYEFDNNDMVNVDINSGTIDGVTIATSDVTVGSGKTLELREGAFNTSAAQNLAIIQGAASNIDIGNHEFRAKTFQSDVATGIAPLIVASTTTVANLEAATVATIAGLAPNTATTQATQAAITTAANLTTVGTIGTGVWQGTAVASAYLDADTAHLTTDQTFSGNKTFSAPITASGAISASGVITAPNFTGQVIALDNVGIYVSDADSGKYYSGKSTGKESGDWEGSALTDPFNVNDELMYYGNILPVSCSKVGFRGGMRVGGGGNAQVWIMTGSRARWDDANTVPLAFGASASVDLGNGQDFKELDIAEFTIGSDCDYIHFFVATDDENKTIRGTGTLFVRT